MTEHPHAEPTPGPWEVATHSGGDGHEIDIQKPNGGGWFLRLSPGYAFAEFPDPEEVKAEFEANVRLIAAAPETAAERDRLVKALEDIVRGNQRCRTATQLMAWAQDIARTALAEARKP